MRISAGTTALALMLLSAGGGAASAQITPAPALDAPTAPLAGPPLNQPPRQVTPESDPSSDPAMSSARVPSAPPGLSKVQSACARHHPGYDPATQSYADPKGRRRPCG